MFHCCLMLTQMHRWGLLKVKGTAHIIPNCDFASVNFLFFNLSGLFLFCFECCILEPDSEEGSTSVRFDFATPALFPPYPLARALLVPFPFHT